MLKTLKYLTFAIFLTAFTPENHLKDQEKEALAQKIFPQIRCLSCEAQSIGDSNTEFSKSLRKIIRQKIKNGKNEKEVKNELKKEFGEQIFMSTSPKSNITIWVLPLIFAIFLGLFIAKKHQ